MKNTKLKIFTPLQLKEDASSTAEKSENYVVEIEQKTILFGTSKAFCKWMNIIDQYVMIEVIARSDAHVEWPYATAFALNGERVLDVDLFYSPSLLYAFKV